MYTPIPMRLLTVKDLLEVVTVLYEVLCKTGIVLESRKCEDLWPHSLWDPVWGWVGEFLGNCCTPSYKIPPFILKGREGGRVSTAYTLIHLTHKSQLSHVHTNITNHIWQCEEQWSHHVDLVLIHEDTDAQQEGEEEFVALKQRATDITVQAKCEIVVDVLNAFR